MNVNKYREWKIVAQQGKYRFLIINPQSPRNAKILDIKTKSLYREFNLQSILARGYWEDYKGSDKILLALLSRVKEVDEEKIASSLFRIAKEILAIDFPTEEAYKKYQGLHPDFNPKNHRVVETKSVAPHKSLSLKNEVRLSPILKEIKPSKDSLKIINKEWRRLFKEMSKEQVIVLTSKIFGFYERVQKRKAIVRVPSDIVGLILSDGHIKNQFQTRRSGGLFDPEERSAMENKAFSIPKEEKGEKRPIYGYLENEKIPSAADWYGDAKIYLKEVVKERSTFTCGDSLGEVMTESFQPSPVFDPKIYSIDHNRFNPKLKDTYSDGALPDEPLGLESNGYNYTELQIHGGLMLRDIEEIVFTKGLDDETKKTLDRASIKYRVEDHS